MDGDCKVMAIIATAIIVGFFGMLATPWAPVAAAVAIVGIAYAPKGENT